MFAFTTILGWCVYGERSAIFLFGDRILKPFRILYTIVVPIGALAQLDLVWILADTFNALMAFPNLIGVLLLSLWCSKPYGRAHGPKTNRARDIRRPDINPFISWDRYCFSFFSFFRDPH